MPKTSAPKAKNPSSTLIHVVISTKELQDCSQLLKLTGLRSWIIAHELGENKHPHIDCAFVFNEPKRCDHLKKSILKLYPDIPEDEKKNIRCVINWADPSIMYLNGYSAKEGDIQFTNVDPFLIADSVEYYLKQKDKVTAEVELKTKFKRPPGVDQIADSCSEFVLSMLDKYSSGNLIPPTNEALIHYVKLFLIKARKERTIGFTVLRKLEKTTLYEMISLDIEGSVSLDYPPPIPPPLKVVPHGILLPNYKMHYPLE